MATLLILTIVSAAVLAGMRSFERQARVIEQSHELIIQAERSVQELRSAEAKQRLYLLTGSTEASTRFQDSAAAARIHCHRPMETDPLRTKLLTHL